MDLPQHLYPILALSFHPSIRVEHHQSSDSEIRREREDEVVVEKRGIEAHQWQMIAFGQEVNRHCNAQHGFTWITAL